MEHASDNYVEEILFQKIAQLLKSNALMLHQLILHPEHSVHSKLVKFSKHGTYTMNLNPRDASLIDCMIIREHSNGFNHDLSLDHQFQSISIVPVMHSTPPSSVFIEIDDGHQIACNEQIDSLLYYEFTDFEFVRGDLPESFSEKECEDLVASLC
jgi:hypothetical protein